MGPRILLGRKPALMTLTFEKSASPLLVHENQSSWVGGLLAWFVFWITVGLARLETSIETEEVCRGVRYSGSKAE